MAWDYFYQCLHHQKLSHRIINHVSHVESMHKSKYTVEISSLNWPSPALRIWQKLNTQSCNSSVYSNFCILLIEHNFVTKQINTELYYWNISRRFVAVPGHECPHKCIRIKNNKYTLEKVIQERSYARQKTLLWSEATF